VSVETGHARAFEERGGEMPLRPAQRFTDAAEAERARFFLWSPVALAAGIAGYFGLPFEPSSWFAITPLIAAFILKSVVTRGSIASLLATAVLLAALGFGLAKARVEAVRAPVLTKSLRGANVVGTIVRVEPRPPRGVRLTLRVEELAGLPIGQRPEIVHVRLMRGGIEAQPGDSVRLSATLSPPAKPAVPGGFDYARTAWFERVGAVGYSFSKPSVEARISSGTISDAWTRAIEALRQTIAARIHAALPGETGSIAAALIMGERGGITTQTNDAYRSSGLFHILSISGLHMVIMAGAVFFSVRLILAAIPYFALTFAIKKWAAAAGILGTFGYLAISGGAFATVRSALMILFIFGAVLLDRPALALRNVAVSAFVILAIFPESLFDAGFQMSFAAVTGLIAAYEEMRRRATRKNEPHPVIRVAMFFGGIVTSTLIASASVAPFAAYHFHQSQQYAVLANLVAIPICNIVVMPAALAALVLMPIGLEKLALVPMGLGIDAMSACANFVAKLPGAVGHIAAIPHLAFILMVMGGLWLALWQTRVRILGVGLILVGLMIAPFMPRPDVLISRNGELVALRGPDGLLSALAARQSKYDLERWLEHDGDARPAAEVQRASAFGCDGVGCVARIKGTTVAVTRHPAAIVDDCAAAGVVIMNQPRPKTCAGAGTVIDFFDVWRDGVHALYIEPDEAGGAPHVRVDTVAAHRGDRPWSPLLAKRDPLQRYLRTPRLTGPAPAAPNSEARAETGPAETAPSEAGHGELGHGELGPGELGLGETENPQRRNSALPNFAARPEWLASKPQPPSRITPSITDDDGDAADLPETDPGSEP
jgi:competence protein ComEC